MKKGIFVSLFFIAFCIQAQTIIYGNVSDEAGPLSSIEVFIEGTDYFNYTDNSGNYEIEVEEGIYEVSINEAGFETIKKTVTAVSGQRVEFSAKLVANNGTSTKLQEVVITASGSKETEAAALNLEFKSTDIVDVVSVEGLKRKAASTAGEGIKTIVGISKESGGSNVYVRGLADRYQNTTFNGLPLPSNDIDKKNINLDLFGTDIIRYMEITKGFSPEIFGDFGAGNIDIVSKEYIGSGFLDFTYGTSINTNAIGQGSDFVRHEGTGGFGYYGRYNTNPYAVVIQNGVDPEGAGFAPLNQSVGISAGDSYKIGEGKLSFFATASFANDYRHIEGLSGNYSDSRDVFFPSFEQFEYGTNTTAMANLIYRFNSKHKIRANALFINDSKSRVGYFGEDGNGFEADLNDDGGFFVFNSFFEQNRIFVNQLLGEHEFSDRFNMEWGVAFNKVLADRPDRRRISLDIGTFGNPDFTTASFIQNNAFDSQRFFQEIVDEDYAASLGFSYAIADNLKFQFGYQGKDKNRDFNSIRYGYDMRNFNDNLNSPGAINRNNFDAIYNLDNFRNNLDDNPNNNFFNLQVLRPAFTGADPILPGGNNRENLPGLPEAIYSGQLTSHAGYMDLEITIGEKLLLIPGLRVENFEQEVQWDVVNVSEGTVSFNETELLPSLIAKYSPNKKTNVRFAASRTLSLPEFKEVAPFVYEGVTQATGGNPDVLNDLSDIYSVDLKAEYKPNRSSLISIGAFTKIITNPVNLVVANDAANTRRYFRTGNEARGYGIEAEFDLDLVEVGRHKIRFGGNAAYLYTNQDLFEGTIGETFFVDFDRTEDRLQGASPFILNADVSFEGNFGNYKPTASIALNYFSDRIFALGSTGRGNQVEKGVPELNFTWQNKISKQYQLDFFAKNILNPNIQIEQENTEEGTVLIESYRRGLNLGLSFKMSF